MKRHKAHKLHYNGHIFTFIYIRGIHISSITLHAISKLWLNGKIVNGLKDMPFRGRQYRILLEEYNVIYSLNLYHHRTYYTRWLWGTNDPHYHRYRATEYRCWQLHTNPFSRKLWYFDFDAWIPTIGGITPNDTNTFIHTFICTKRHWPSAQHLRRLYLFRVHLRAHQVKDAEEETIIIVAAGF